MTDAQDQNPATMPPKAIENRSFAVIAEELEKMGVRVPEETAPVVHRVIHTTADFDYAENLIFSPGVVGIAHAALRAGAVIVTDTAMARAGINAAALRSAGAEAHCRIADEDVAEEAEKTGVTRSRIAVDKAARLWPEAVFAVGNAPTALIRICELVAEGALRPPLVIGVPVGFVNVVESKEMLLRSGVPHIVARGRKGGSTVAAAICNALLYSAVTVR
jgi:precorrin-8X/cobalt-precorrin-8 methylmutase